jgi:hypothetical protein
MLIIVFFMVLPEGLIAVRNLIIIIKDLLDRLRALCARWSEVLNYQCTA